MLQYNDYFWSSWKSAWNAKSTMKVGGIVKDGSILSVRLANLVEKGRGNKERSGPEQRQKRSNEKMVMVFQMTMYYSAYWHFTHTKPIVFLPNVAPSSPGVLIVSFKTAFPLENPYDQWPFQIQIFWLLTFIHWSTDSKIKQSSMTFANPIKTRS